MTEPPHHDNTATPSAAHALLPARRTYRRLALILLVKLGMAALLLALPAGLAISRGAAHAAVLLLVLAAGAGTLVIRRRRGSTARPGPAPRPPHAHWPAATDIRDQ